MDCSGFQDTISDYLDGTLEARCRAESAAHRLRCRACRDLYNDVRATVAALGGLSEQPVEHPAHLETRILAATSAGDMLSCAEFDRLLERYFDGVILAQTFQTFQSHFEQCLKCRRLLGSIEDAIEMCREVKAEEVEVPPSLHDRIVAATTGVRPLTRRERWRRSLPTLITLAQAVWSPQMAAAALICLATGMMIVGRYGSVGGLASQAGAEAGRLVDEGHSAINQTSALALSGLQMVSSEFNQIWREKRVERRPAPAGKGDPRQRSNPAGAGSERR